MATTMSAFALMRRLCRQLNPQKNLRQSPAWQYVTGRSRELKAEGTSTQTDGEVATLHNYLVYLQSSAKHKDLVRQFGGKGERPVQEAAHLVGLKLPEMAAR